MNSSRQSERRRLDEPRRGCKYEFFNFSIYQVFYVVQTGGNIEKLTRKHFGAALRVHSHCCLCVCARAR